jgi:hypothetical protein
MHYAIARVGIGVFWCAPEIVTDSADELVDKDRAHVVAGHVQEWSRCCLEELHV